MNTLPTSLTTAYEWTKAAGELTLLRKLSDDMAVLAYCRASVRNYRAAKQLNVGQWKDALQIQDLMQLRTWLRKARTS